VLRIRPHTDRSGRSPGGPIVNRWALLAIPVIAFLIVGFVVPLVVIGQRSVTELPAGSDGSPIAN
jgi:hypothetical protein